MIYKEFKNKWLGKRVDYDKSFGFQCVDLIKQYLNECFGIKAGAWGNAIDYWNKPHATILKHFDKITGTTDIKEGDIVITSEAMPYGHIAIANSSTSMLEQNGGSGNGDGLGTNAIKIRTIPKNKLVGILRSKTMTEQKFTLNLGGKTSERTGKQLVGIAERYYKDYTDTNADLLAHIKLYNDLSKSKVALDTLYQKTLLELATERKKREVAEELVEEWQEDDRLLRNEFEARGIKIIELKDALKLTNEELMAKHSSLDLFKMAIKKFLGVV